MATNTQSSKPVSIVAYKYPKPGIFLFFLLCFFVCIACFRAVGYDDISPFISIPQDLVYAANKWAMDPACWPNHHWVDQFFLIDCFFPVLAFIVALFLLVGFHTSKRENHVRTVNLGWGRFWSQLKKMTWKKDWYCIGLLVCCLLAMVFDYVENWQCIKVIKCYSSPVPGQVCDSSVAASLQAVKIIFYGTTWLGLLVIVARKILEDYFPTVFKKVVSDLWRYFYPSLINIVVLVVVFASFGQFDALVIELVEPRNFFLLSGFFLVSLFTVWFLPYYLKFTDAYYEIRKGEKKHIFKSVFTISDEASFKAAFAEHENDYDKHIFHPLRRLIAFSYFLTLIYLLARTIQHASPKGISPFLVVLIVAISLFVMNLKFQSIYKKAVNKNGKLPVGHAFFCFLVLLAVMVTYLPLLFEMEEKYWYSRLVLMLVNISLFCLLFLAFTLYRRIRDKAQFESEKFPALAGWLNKRLDGFHIESNNAIMAMLLVGAPAVFLIYLVFLLSDLNKFETLNPINIYLIVLNGLLAFVAIVDRTLRLEKIQKKSVEGGEKKTVWTPILGGVAFVFLGLFIATRAVENKYHDIDYVTVEKQNYPNSLKNLREFTADFLERDTSGNAPVYLIAADGGGLRAAYWNLLVMNYLDSQNSTFYNHVFMATGASGGCIGQGMYAYLKGKDTTPKARTITIDSIGKSNFLSSDMVGLIGRNVIASFVPIPIMNRWEDRMEAMARHYFTIAGETKETYRVFKKEPFGKLWTDSSNYKKLPIFIVSTTRAEDGLRGVVHPLSKTGEPMAGLIDLTRINQNEYISFPDALFLTNRFPVFSPSGRIESKGHFVDGGYLENSGLSTLAHYLVVMKGLAKEDPVFQQFFQRKIHVISIRNDKSGYIFDNFKNYKDATNYTAPASELASIIGAAVSGGLTALPQYYDGLFSDKSFQNLIGENGFDFTRVDLPFYIEVNDVHRTMKGQVPSCGIKAKVDSLNNNISGDGLEHLVMPPLGRIMPDPTVNYMKKMLENPVVKDSLGKISSDLK